MVSKLKTIIWYLKQPKFYKQLAILLKRVLFPHPKEKSGTEALNWCSKNSITTKEYFTKSLNYEIAEFNSLFKKLIEEGDKLINKTPVNMGGPGNLTLLYYITLSIKASKVVETGVAYGWSSLAILKALNEIGGGRLVSTDMPYAKMNNEQYVGLVVPDYLKDKWKIIRLPDITGLPQALKGFDEIDLCHYDSDKSYRGRMWAYPRLWKSLRSGGYLISDDISDNIAFKEFSERVNVNPYIIRMPSQYVGVMVKP